MSVGGNFESLLRAMSTVFDNNPNPNHVQRGVFFNWVANRGGLVIDGLVALGAFCLFVWETTCLLYTSPSPRDQRGSRMPSSA